MEKGNRPSAAGEPLGDAVSLIHVNFMHFQLLLFRYKPFKKNLYQEHPDIMNLTPQQTFELRIALDVCYIFLCYFHFFMAFSMCLQIRIYGRDPPKPVVSFAHFNFDKAIMAQIRRSEFEKPTPVQAQVFFKFLC
jgi:hypothetical protein